VAHQKEKRATEEFKERDEVVESAIPPGAVEGDDQAEPPASDSPPAEISESVDGILNESISAGFEEEAKADELARAEERLSRARAIVSLVPFVPRMMSARMMRSGGPIVLSVCDEGLVHIVSDVIRVFVNSRVL
jgi:hypothetical protein